MRRGVLDLEWTSSRMGRPSCEAPSRKPRFTCPLERPFACPVDGCPLSYARKDHLNRHMEKHKGEIYPCPVQGCSSKFTTKSNIQRHVNEFHQDGSPCKRKEEHMCGEAECGKRFPYLSKLKRHEDSHAKLEYTEVLCGEPGCMKMFTNTECLRAHTLSCHRYIKCKICGTKQLKKNFKRHQRTHEYAVCEKIKCAEDDCERSYSNKSNLTKHVKVCHESHRPFACRFSGCGLRFAYKHVRNNHEKCAAHLHVPGDFEAADEEHRLRPRGGQKRKPIPMESLTRKRVALPGEEDALPNGSDYMKWILS